MAELKDAASTQFQAAGRFEAGRQLQQVYGLLAVHPAFRVETPLAPSPRPWLRWAGKLLAVARLCVRGVRFAGGGELLAFGGREMWPGWLILDFQWRPPAAPGCEALVRLQGPDGVSAQDRWPFADYAPDALGFICPRRMMRLPAEAPAGGYRVEVCLLEPGGDARRPAWRLEFSAASVDGRPGVTAGKVWHRKKAAPGGPW